MIILRRLGDTCLNWAFLHNIYSLKSGSAVLLYQRQSFWSSNFWCQYGIPRKMQEVQKSAEKHSGLHILVDFQPLVMRCHWKDSRRSFLWYNLWRSGECERDCSCLQVIWQSPHFCPTQSSKTSACERIKLPGSVAVVVVVMVVVVVVVVVVVIPETCFLSDKLDC